MSEANEEVTNDPKPSDPPPTPDPQPAPAPPSGDTASE